MVQKSFVHFWQKPLLPSKVSLEVQKVNIIPPKINKIWVRELGSGSLRPGMRFKTGEIVRNDGLEVFVSPFTGSIVSVGEVKGYLNRQYTEIVLEKDDEEQISQDMETVLATKDPERILNYINLLPGELKFSVMPSNRKLDVIYISLMDEDPFTFGSQVFIKEFHKEIIEAISFLKELANRQVVVLPEDGSITLDTPGMEQVRIVPAYPHSLPQMIIKQISGKEISSRERLLDYGMAWLDINHLIVLGQVLFRKSVDIIRPLFIVENGSKPKFANAKIGMPFTHILESIGAENYRAIAINSLLKGLPLFSLDHPTLSHTCSVFLIPEEDIPEFVDHQCINCGECVKICPSRLPVNMLIRYLQNRRYEDAVKNFDLLSCMECGMCTYVCVAKIPIFHYIMLGKYEWQLIKEKEETDANA